MKPKGFAWMKIHQPDRLRIISRNGGRRSQALHVGAKPWTREEARVQAAAGGRARWKKREKEKGAA